MYEDSKRISSHTKSFLKSDYGSSRYEELVDNTCNDSSDWIVDDDEEEETNSSTTEVIYVGIYFLKPTNDYKTLAFRCYLRVLFF